MRVWTNSIEETLVVELSKAELAEIAKVLPSAKSGVVEEFKELCLLFSKLDKLETGGSPS